MNYIDIMCRKNISDMTLPSEFFKEINMSSYMCYAYINEKADCLHVSTLGIVLLVLHSVTSNI